MGEILEFTAPPLPNSCGSSCASILPDSVETIEKSSPTAPIRALVAQSLTLSSSDRDHHPSAPAQTLFQLQNPDSYPSSSSQETLADPALPPSSDCCMNSEGLCSQVTPGAQILPASDCGDNPGSSGAMATCDIENENEPKVEQTELGWNSCSSTWSGLQQEPSKIKSTGVGAGLWNLGNTCFMNAVLQCITHTVPLIGSLWSYKQSKPCNCGCENFCVTQVLRDHIELALRSSGYHISPVQFVENLNYISSAFQRYHQEDAHEFLQSFLDKLERCCLDYGNNSGYIASQGVNIVKHVFGGSLVSRLRCCDCNSFSDTRESTLCLSLEIEDVDDLARALESFTCVEKLEDQLTCDNCKAKVLKEKQLMLDKLPLVATFHLKRFKSEGYYMEKIFKHVEFPLELDLQPYTSGNQENDISTTYHLYALVEHHGSSLTYGHYSSYVRSAHETWHKFDDSEVTRIEEGCVLSRDAYILFYAREGTPWFSSAFEQIKPLVEANMSNSSPKSVLDPTYREYPNDENMNNNTRADKSCNLVEEVFQSIENSASCCPDPEPQEEVFHSAESNSNDSPFTDASEPPEAEDYDKPSIDSSSSLQQEESIHGDGGTIANTCSSDPVLDDVGKKDSSETHPESTFQIQWKHLEIENKKETFKLPFKSSKMSEAPDRDVALRYLKSRPSQRARMLAAAMADGESTATPTKRMKTASNMLKSKRPSASRRSRPHPL